jgi:hypothetical protein
VHRGTCARTLWRNNQILRGGTTTRSYEVGWEGEAEKEDEGREAPEGAEAAQHRVGGYGGCSAAGSA